MTKKLLAIGAGPFQQAGIRRARQMGFTVVAIDGNHSAPGLREADVPVTMDIRDVVGAINLAREHRIEGVFTIAVESAINTVAAVAQELKLPGPSVEAAKNATDKYRMRKIWSANGIPSPDFFLCHSLKEATAAAEAIGFPLVVKPSNSSGSRGVSKVEGITDLPLALKSAKQVANDGSILIEQFMTGDEISVEGFVFGKETSVLTLSDKIRTAPPHLLDTTVLFPSNQGNDVQDRTKRIVSDAVTVLGVDTAPIHAEVMLTPCGPMMVELAARGPGFKVFTDMIPWVTGVDVVTELIRMSVGEKPAVIPQCSRGAVLHFPRVPPGTVTFVQGIEEAKRIDGISEVDIYVKPGDEIRRLTSGADRVGHIISAAKTRSEALLAVQKAERVIRIEVQCDSTVFPENRPPDEYERQGDYSL